MTSPTRTMWRSSSGAFALLFERLALSFFPLRELVMTDTDQKQEDDVLRRMLATKPKPHKLGGKAEARPPRRSQEKEQ